MYFTDLISDEEFDAYVIRVLEVWKSEPRYVLGVADQVPPLSRPERIRAGRAARGEVRALRLTRTGGNRIASYHQGTKSPSTQSFLVSMCVFESRRRTW